MKNSHRTFCRKCMSTLLEGEGVVVAGIAQCIECRPYKSAPIERHPEAQDEWPMMSQDDWRDHLNPNEGCK